LGGEGAGVFADQVVQLVAAGRGFGEQVLVIQALQAAAGGAEGGAVERRGGVGVDVRAGVQAEQAEQPLLIIRQVLVGQAESRPELWSASHRAACFTPCPDHMQPKLGSGLDL
jgi:hypothetical protein